MADAAADDARVEAERRQANKLEAVGQLAAGVAHEINTPIQFVGDNVQFMRDAFASLATLIATYQGWLSTGPPPEEERRAAEDAADLEYLKTEIPRAIAETLDGVSRVATIVRALKEFAHPDGREQIATDLNQALRSTLTVAHNELKYVADVALDLGELPPVVCHPGDLNQVFLNLLVNAAHAIADKGKGQDRRGHIGVRTVADGAWVVVSISDDGGGIPAAIRERIFDPFFTTKEVGRGTGQGLAIARAVIERHRGSLTFETEEGRGTTFVIRLPVAGAASVDQAAAE